MNQTVWERHVALSKAHRAEVATVLHAISEKYEPLYEALRDECELQGHSPRFSHFNVGGDPVFRCNLCGKRVAAPAEVTSSNSRADAH